VAEAEAEESAWKYLLVKAEEKELMAGFVADAETGDGQNAVFAKTIL